MKHIFKKLVLITILIAPTFNLSGCAYYFTNCNKFAVGSQQYHECLAAHDVKEAQYVLGLEAYETGDIKTAKKWLKRAARPESKTIPVYMPPVGGQKYGTIMYFDKPSPQPGHSDARILLNKIEDEEKKKNDGI